MDGVNTTPPHAETEINQQDPLKTLPILPVNNSTQMSWKGVIPYNNNQLNSEEMIIKEVKDPEEDQTTLDGEVEEEERDNKTFIQSYSEMTLQTDELQFTFQENELVKVNARELKYWLPG